jgi:hypothetical protein
MFLFNIFPVDMSINLGSGNISMAEHFLDGSQIGTAFKQMRGK